jgi:hypothetical protein
VTLVRFSQRVDRRKDRGAGAQVTLAPCGALDRETFVSFQERQ